MKAVKIVATVDVTAIYMTCCFVEKAPTDLRWNGVAATVTKAAAAINEAIRAGRGNRFVGSKKDFILTTPRARPTVVVSLLVVMLTLICKESGWRLLTAFAVRFNRVL